jgi:HTH-type transcriptional regulator/antitoxin HigA
MMEQRGLSRRDLEPFIGSRARVAEILNRKRALTLPMIRRLSEGLQIPAEILVRDYPIERAA